MKIKKLLSGILAAAITLASVNVGFAEDSTDPSTESETFEISTADDLYNFAAYVNEGNTTANAVLTADIVVNKGDVANCVGTKDESWTEWTPIGNSTYPYSGTFDGQGHTISGLYFNDTSTNYVGLLGYASGAEISNVSVENSYIRGYSYIGSICGRTDSSTITDCINLGTISSSYYYLGGICGYAYSSTITNCTSSSDVSSSNRYVGGICGYAYNSITITECINLGDVSSSSYYVGGICGDANSSIITDCTNSGDVSSSSSYIGGICGDTNSSTITDCTNSGSILGSNSYIGGICGRANSSAVTNCYYLKDTATNGINGSNVKGSAEVKTAEEFASGSVAWLLNGKTAENSVWYQNLDNKEEIDIYPVLDSTHGTVYCEGTQYCPNNIDAKYTNTAVTLNVLSYIHTYDSEGICSICGIGYKEPNTIDNIYQISNKGELYWFAEYVNTGNTNANAVLTADIIINEGDIAKCEGVKTDTWSNWTPIGNRTYPYTGTFDGQGFSISGLYYNDTSASYAGLFGYANGAAVSNVSVENSYTNGYSYVGGICGYAYGSSTITDCTNSGSILGSNSYAGGICGRAGNSTITDCKNLGAISSSSSYAGGICGLAGNSTITGCTNSGSVSNSSSYAGGICGDVGSSTIIDCINSGTVSSSSSYVSGICGDAINSTITDCANSGTVSSSSSYVGGICGDTYGNTITDCANSGTVSSSSSYVGGICGDAYGNTITNCINTGNTSGSSYVGAICGYANSGNTAVNCYYLTDTAACGINSTADKDSTEVKTAEEFSSGSVAWLLNGKSAENAVWHQNLDNEEEADIYPILDSSHGTVYYVGTQYCPNNIDAKYTNTVGTINILSAVHIYNNEGICSICGTGYKEPKIINDVYQISNKGELYWFAAYVNAGNTSANAVLTADIVVNEGDVASCEGTKDESWTEWTPIGNYTYRYAGAFDGQGYSINGLYYNNTSSNCTGLFGYISGAAISNVSVENSYINGYRYVGGICGYADSSTITNCSNKCIVSSIVSSSSSYVGGICGYASKSTITDCSNLDAISSSSSNVGGICGYAISSTITNCSNEGIVSSSSSYIGGICGRTKSGTITSCISINKVLGKNYIGGICGYADNSSTITDCINSGEISSSSSNVGGICGYAYSCTITNCHSIGTVTGNSYIGGICGRLYSGTITNCYYLEGSAAGGIESTDVSGSAEVKTSAEFADGTVTWLLNGKTSDGAWYQNIDNGETPDTYPVLDTAHGTVHIVVDDGSYTNNDISTGDVSGNGKITSLDAALVLKYISGIDVSLNLDAADANNDNEININDAVKILESITA